TLPAHLSKMDRKSRDRSGRGHAVFARDSQSTRSRCHRAADVNRKTHPRAFTKRGCDRLASQHKNSTRESAGDDCPAGNNSGKPAIDRENISTIGAVAAVSDRCSNDKCDAQRASLQKIISLPIADWLLQELQ